MTPVPKVTVLMAVYNGERYVREAIDSILGQTFADFEFLIINDGSTDQSRAIICSYHDPRLCLIDNENNLGLTKSLNRGIAAAQGEYLARMDADDVSMPERFARQVAFLDAHPETALVGSAAIIINDRHDELERMAVPVEHDLIRTQLFFGNAFFHASVMGRTRVFRELRYDEDAAYAQDYLLWSRMAFRYPVANLNEPLLCFRAHAASISHQKAMQQDTVAQQVARLHLETLLQTTVPADRLERHYQLLKARLKPKTLSRRDRLRMLQWLDRLVKANQRRRLYDHNVFRQRLRVYWQKFFSADVFYHGGVPALLALFSPCRQFTGREKAAYLARYVGHALRYLVRQGRQVFGNK